MISTSSAGARASSHARARAIRRWLIEEVQTVAPIGQTLHSGCSHGLCFRPGVQPSGVAIILAALILLISPSTLGQASRCDPLQ
jgi:hypothetical protein